ncbi:MAG: hypothetical protein KF895_06765 [Parvibaculum sp.]|nr:hypothetical protein [Parvibaculum sp.]
MSASVTHSRLAGRDAPMNETPPDVRFIRVPSIAERKLGTSQTAPMRLDPRVLDKMQTTIRKLETKYAEALSAQVSMVQLLIEPAAKGDMEARERLYSLMHDMRGLAGTFGFPVVGRFANSLCLYIEKARENDWRDASVIRFHVDAIREAVDNPGTDPAITTETLAALERLIASDLAKRKIAG